MAPRPALTPRLRRQRTIRRIRRAVARRNRPLVGWAEIAACLRQSIAIVQAWHEECPMPISWTPDGPTTTPPALDRYFRARYGLTRSVAEGGPRQDDVVPPGP